MVKRLRKRHWKQHALIWCGVTLIGLLQWQSSSGEKENILLPLADGKFQIVEIIDPLTFRVQSTTAEKTPVFCVKVVGVRVPVEMACSRDEIYQQLCRESIQFERETVELEFDRCFQESEQVALAHLQFHGKYYHVQLAEQGLVVPYSIPGNSASISRKIRLANRSAKTKGLGMYRRP